MSRFANSKALQRRPMAASVQETRPPETVVTRPVPTADRWYEDQDNVLRKLGVFLLLAYGFVRFSFLSDVANHIIGSKPFIVIGLGVPTAILMLLSGGIRRTFRGRPTS